MCRKKNLNIIRNLSLKKTILITGATDGIGLTRAKMLAANGHNLLIHGRNPEKLNKVEQVLLSCLMPEQLQVTCQTGPI
jgi:short-subunit dehydrogenase